MTRAMLKISSINSQRFGIVNIYLPLFIQKGQGDPLEKEIATHPCILAWKNPIVRGTWQATVHKVAKSWT